MIFDDIQTELKWNSIITEMFTKGRHYKIGILSFEQFTQDAAHIEKANTDFIILKPPFSL